MNIARTWFHSALVCFALGLSLTPTPAAALEVKEVVAGVEKTYANVDAMQANFVQVAHTAFGPETTKGKVTVKRPSKMRWEFEAKPGEERLFVTDGSKMWVYAAEDQQVIEYDDISAQQGTMDSLLTSLDKLDELFDVTLNDATDASIHVTLKPLDDAGQFKSVEVWFAPDYEIQKVNIADTFDNVTSLTFSSVNLGVKVADSLFTFKVPEGTTVVKATTN